MAGRGSQTFKKRQKEQQRKEKQQEKFAKRLERKGNRMPLPREEDLPTTPENLQIVDDITGEISPDEQAHW